ncbi:MAG: CheR family methyltransferase [Terriglobales bacterium]
MPETAQEREQLSLSQLVDELASLRGLDLRGYKHTTLERRVRKRMFEVGAGTYTDYLNKIRDDGDEINLLLNTVLINVTEFFRDAPAWDFLRAQIIPSMLRKLKPGDTFRAWSAGCATGEEAYSLAILMADTLGDRLPEFNIKIYGTDVDEEALNVARRGDFSRERLRRLRPEWRERYFYPRGAALRIARDVRRLCIFGRSNVLSDAPISRCNMILCRNVLIYFDTDSQKVILEHLHYALEPGGILFLGKAESKLSGWQKLRSLHPRWRIFQKFSGESDWEDRPAMETNMPDTGTDSAVERELRSFRLHQRYIMEALKSGIMVLDNSDTVTSHNESALAIWGLPVSQITGRQLQSTAVAQRCPEMSAKLDATRGRREPLNFNCSITVGDEERTIAVSLRPIVNEPGERIATLIHCEDVTTQGKLETTIEQLESTSEELQSTNEELETANEELQSTNEELETTNEELQSTNEELETTNEELQSLNEELENINEELESRTRELNDLSQRYAQTLQQMPWPVMLLDHDLKIQLWNGAAQRLFGVGSTSVVGVSLDKLPLDETLRKTLVRRVGSVVQRQQPATITGLQFPKRPGENYDISLTFLTRNESGLEGTLVMFGPFYESPGAARKSTSSPANSARRHGKKKTLAKPKPAARKKR